MKGLVTDIQRFSVHDGPGIRTTVFLKGCNMRCAWCHNPEAIKMRPELELFLDKCIGCSECFKVCPEGAHDVEDGKRIFHRELCVGCGKCAKTCYAEALVLIGREMEDNEVFDEVRQDEEYYRNSGGGVTISGGEPLFQRKFTYSILKLCKDNGINTAIESNMSFPFNDAAELFPALDLIIMDIKAMDDDIHRKWTGISNEQILKNAQLLFQTDIPLIIRTPVIPGINDNAESIGMIADFISGSENLLYYELLPYHPLGTDKYFRLGIEYKLKGIKPPDKTKMEMLAGEAQKHGVKVRLSGMDAGKGDINE